MFCGLDIREGLETGTDWQEFVMNSTPDSMIRELESITEIVDEMDKQVDVLEAIDDNDIMEHAYSQITPEDC